MLACFVDHFGESVLCGEPELPHEITGAVRAVVPEQIPITAKMWLDIANTSRAVDFAEIMTGHGAISELLAA